MKKMIMSQMMIEEMIQIIYYEKNKIISNMKSINKYLNENKKVSKKFLNEIEPYIMGLYLDPKDRINSFIEDLDYVIKEANNIIEQEYKWEEGNEQKKPLHTKEMWLDVKKSIDMWNQFNEYIKDFKIK